jgi:hypothetical protein
MQTELDTFEERLVMWAALHEPRPGGDEIDPATAEVTWRYTQTGDPYGLHPDLGTDHKVTRDYFARNPGGEWFWFGDLPDDTAAALWKRFPEYGKRSEKSVDGGAFGDNPRISPAPASDQNETLTGELADQVIKLIDGAVDNGIQPSGVFAALLTVMGFCFSCVKPDVRPSLAQFVMNQVPEQLEIASKHDVELGRT